MQMPRTMSLLQEKQSSKDNETEYFIDNEYIMYSKIKLGNGHFGRTFKGISIKSKLEYAIKIEQNDILAPQLQKEYTLLRELRGQHGIPNVYYFKDHGQDKAMVIDLLGQNLEEVMKNTKQKCFSMKTVLMIGDQLLNILHCIHEKEVIHRDLKPENMAIGLRPRHSNIFLIDFGLSCKYINPKTNQHIQYRDKKPFVGTPMFASTHTHLGIEQSRRDDLESLGYILGYFALGELPWQKIKSKSKEDKLEKMMNIKCNIKDNNGILSKELPGEFQLYFVNVFKLGFAEKPNYLLLRGLLNTAKSNLGEYIDNVFDWCCEEINEHSVFLLRELKEKEKEENQKRMKKEKEIITIDIGKTNIIMGDNKQNCSIRKNNTFKKENTSKIIISSKKKEDIMNNKHSYSLKRKDSHKKIFDHHPNFRFFKKDSK